MTFIEISSQTSARATLRRQRNGLLVVITALAASIAIRAASQVTVPVKSDLGLAAVLPSGFWFGLVALNLLMVIAISSSRPSRPLLALLLGSLVVVLYGAPMFSTGTPRGEVAWRHLGIVGNIMSSRSIDPTIDGYFNWPGFFAGLAGVIESTGISPQGIALVAPIFNVLLWLGATAVIVRSFTSDSRRLWLSLWLFTLGNWIDQDYLSPQAFAFFLYVALLGVALTTLAARTTVPFRAAAAIDGWRGGIRIWWNHREPVEPDARRRVAGMALAVLLGVTIVISHQLTPFVLITSLLMLTLTGRIWSPGLVVIIGLVLVIWLNTGASTYLAGHPVLFVDDPNKAVAANLAQRFTGSSGHVIVVEIRTALMALMWGLALLGFAKLWRQGRRDIRPLVLMVAPFFMIPAQSYGGEILLRVALFSLPFTAYLIASLLLPRSGRFSFPVSAQILTVCLVVSLSTVIARYGNARFDMFTRGEIDGARALYRLAPAHAVLIAGTHPTPWRFEDYAKFRHITIPEVCKEDLADVPACFALIDDRARRNPEGALVMLNLANQDSLRILNELPSDAFIAITDRFMSSPDFSLVYRNRDALIFQFPPRVK